MEQKNKKIYIYKYMVRDLRDLRDFPMYGDVKSWQYIIIQIIFLYVKKIL